MGTIGLDSDFDFFETIWALGWFLVILQLIAYGIRGSYSFYKSNGRVKKNGNIKGKKKSALNLFFSFHLLIFHYIPLILYLFSIIISIFSNYNFFHHTIFNFDKYLVSFTQLLIVQFLIICFSGLLWYFSNNKIHKIILWGLSGMSLNIIIEVVWQFFRYSFFYWLQIVQLLVPGLILLIIPSTGYLVFNHLYKLHCK